MKLNHKTHDINFVKGKEYIEFEGSFPKNMKRERCLYRKEKDNGNMNYTTYQIINKLILVKILTGQTCVRTAATTTT